MKHGIVYNYRMFHVKPRIFVFTNVSHLPAEGRRNMEIAENIAKKQ